MVRIAPARRQSCSSRGPRGFLAAVLLLASQTGLPASALARSPSIFPVFGENGYGTAFLCDSSGLFLTEQRLVTGAIPPRIVISPNLVVRARVLVENPDRGIAVLWVNSADVAGMDVM